MIVFHESSWSVSIEIGKNSTIMAVASLMQLPDNDLASYPGSRGEGKGEPGINCVRMRLIKGI